MPRSVNNSVPPPLPSSIKELRDRAQKVREQIISQYLAISTTPLMPAYMREKNITLSHILRSEIELNNTPEDIDINTEAHHAYTSSMIHEDMLKISGASLTEICIGVMGGVLKTRGELQTGAGFFSTMVACVDDYLDKEGSYLTHGEDLFYLSHACRDLMDIALTREAEQGNITAQELHSIKLRLFDIIKTLISSEKAEDADSYLYKKSCGDKVIGALFPITSAHQTTQKNSATIGRLVGEAGQLIDDIMDYDYDLAKNGKNHITMSRSGIKETIRIISKKLNMAERVTALLPKGRYVKAVAWILTAMKNIVKTFNKTLSKGKKIAQSTLTLSSPLTLLISKRTPANQLLMWF